MNNYEIKKILADNIRLLRTQKRFSQEAIAELANIGQNQISEIENARSNPSLDTLIKISEALNTNISNLFTEKIF